MNLGSWDTIARYTGWKPKPLRNAETLEKIDALDELAAALRAAHHSQYAYSSFKGKPITPEQREQLWYRGYR